MSKQVQKVCNAISTVAVVLVVILALLLVGVRLVGLRPMCVLSGSMEPTYHTGSLIYVKPCAPEDVQVGDAITFVLNEDLDVVTHRVISIDAENEHFYTQGDANDAPDGAPVYFKNLIGKIERFNASGRSVAETTDTSETVAAEQCDVAAE